jgi:hypothetical protein
VWRSRALLSESRRELPKTLEHISAKEWGRRQAAASPMWTEEKWRRACAMLRVELAEPVDGQHDEHQDQGEAAGWVAAA